ncbi:hypothetical protein [Azospirillum doebereinerae]|uniref:Lipoprotein n=1 Tax=Azospirillum doebereinerae TaxID=92933 RepID=A0A433J3J3_9PROT|nr:hypothetical protein [Azospirillum doebereinerae]RUQ66352.1 hypothetical protein EJ913_22825 [Azospirillum doebereinerae]
MINVENTRRLVMALAMSSTLTACAMTAQQCDPALVNNVLAAANCNILGGFDAHLQTARAEVEALRAELAATQTKAAGMDREAQLLAGNRDALQRKMTSEKRDLDRLQLKLAGMRVEGDKARAKLAALQEQLKVAETKLSGMDKSNVTAEEIAALEADIAARKEAVTRLSGRALQE